MRKQLGAMAPTAAFTPGAGFAAGYEEQVRQNLALFDRAMKMFSPFAFQGADGHAHAAPAAPAPAPAPAATKPEEAAPEPSLEDLKKQMEAMQAQLAALAKKA